MLLTAIAATVVLVSAVANLTRDAEVPHPPPARGTQLAEQPLVGLGAGVTVREITQETPFSLVALTGDLAGTSTRVRAKRSDGSWGPWYQTEYETAAPDSPGRPAGNRTRWTDRGTAQHRSGVRRHHHDGADRGDPPAGRHADAARRAALPVGERRPGLQARLEGTALRTEHLRDPHLPAASPGRNALDAAGGGAACPASRRRSSAAPNGAPTSRCAAVPRSTTTGFAPPSSTTPRAATTTPRWNRRGSSRPYTWPQGPPPCPAQLGSAGRGSG